MKNKKTLKYLPLVMAAFVLIATISVGSDAFADQMSIFTSYGKDATKYITNAKGFPFGNNTEIKDPFNTYIKETQSMKITVHPNGIAELVDKLISPNSGMTMIELPENMSIDEYINNN